MGSEVGKEDARILMDEQRTLLGIGEGNQVPSIDAIQDRTPLFVTWLRSPCVLGGSYLVEMRGVLRGRIELAMCDAGSAVMRWNSPGFKSGRSHGIFVLQRSFGNKKQFPYRDGRAYRILVGRDAIFVDDAQRSKALLFRVPIVSKRKTCGMS